MNEEVPCSSHPDAPHSFMRDASHNTGRYVCECEGWLPSSIYEDNGYQSRSDYLECLSEDYNVPLDTVEALANLYGEVEMFDGLVTALQDIEGVCE